jgi:hypothetical protein
MPTNRSIPNNIHWVIDTCIFYFSCGFVDSSEKADFSKKIIDLELTENAQELLRIIRNKDTLILDLEGEIEDEYYRCLKRVHSPYLEIWLEYMNSTSGKIKRISSNILPQEQIKLNELNFHTDDIPFLGTGKNSIDKIIVSNDTDYNKDEDIEEYIMRQLNISVCQLCYGCELSACTRITVEQHRRKQLIDSALNEIQQN